MLRQIIRNPCDVRIRCASELYAAARKSGARLVSIDMFDTLVYRTVVEPTDVFILQYQAQASCLEQLSVDQWLSVRQSAEDRIYRSSYPAEVNISEIYDAVASMLHLDPERRTRLLDEELKQQRRTIRPYRQIVDVLRRLKREGIAIAVVTDIYLPHDFIRDILDKYLDFDYTLLCSSENRKTKRSGEAYFLLKSMFSGQKIVHFGDHYRSDVRMARRAGLTAFETCWARHAALISSPAGRYIRSLGVAQVATPWDQDDVALENTSRVVDELAWKWSFVLVDFLIAVNAYARRVGATDIWFLSRDCETMFQSITDVPGLFAGMQCRYVYGSRACVYPIIAESQPDLYEKWYGRKADLEAERQGRLARRYFNSLLNPETSRVLIVDIGWRGRMQAILNGVLPDGVDVHGFYFSLDPRAEQTTKEKSDVFVKWDLSVLTTPVIEMLSGFSQPSVVGLAAGSEGFQPIFRESGGDRAPPEYCRKLRFYLSKLLSDRVEGRYRSDPHLRKEMVRKISLYPDRPIVDELAQWSIGSLIDASDTVTITSGGRASRLDRLIGRSVSGNLWPSAAVWTLTSRPILVRALQHGIRFKLAAKRLVLPNRP